MGTLSSMGRLFQSLGPATLNERYPCFWRDLGMTTVQLFVADLNGLAG